MNSKIVLGDWIYKYVRYDKSNKQPLKGALKNKCSWNLHEEKKCVKKFIFSNVADLQDYSQQRYQ